MKLILCRHGLAMERDDFISQGKEDSLRPLVPKGHERSKLAAKWLKQVNPDFDLIVSSPFVRARQTAEIFAETLKISNLFEAPELVPQAPPNSFAQWLKLHADESLSVLAVGHEPQLGLFASWCLTGQKESFLDLKKSGLIGLSVESLAEIRPGTAELDFVISPKLMEV